MSMGRRDQMEFAQPLMEEQFSQTQFIDAASQRGYDLTALQQLLDEVVAWSARPDAFWALMMCHAIGWAS
jgi:hypothetical protein